jgi:hypothetical protein
VGFLGLKVAGVLLKSAMLFDLVEEKLGDKCDVQVGNWESAQLQANVVLVDGSAETEVLNVAQRAGACLVLSTVRKRKSCGSDSSWTQVIRE